ncbi:MAG TPA: VOC family protein [Chloroflexota bacterium]|nr:VOC family protein [Chloroflexota bacterium]
MLTGFGHIGIGVKDIEKSVAALCKLLEIPVPPIKEVPEKKAKVALVDLWGIGLEFIQDDSEDGMLGRFNREKGNGIHHFCLLTDDIEGDIKWMMNRGVKMMHETPRVGLRDKRVAFISPDSNEGVPIELSEP